MSDKRLNRELSQAGASHGELTHLSDIAETLSSVTPPGLSKQARHRMDARMAHLLEVDSLEDVVPTKKKQAHKFNPFAKWSLVGAGGFASLAVVLVIAAQFAMPGSPLYGIKRGIEEVRTFFQPDYVDKVLEKRKEEVEALEKQDTVDPVTLDSISDDYKRTMDKAEEKHKQSDPKWDSSQWRSQWDWSSWYKQYQQNADKTKSTSQSDGKQSGTSGKQQDSKSQKGLLNLDGNSGGSGLWPFSNKR